MSLTAARRRPEVELYAATRMLAETFMAGMCLSQATSTSGSGSWRTERPWGGFDDINLRERQKINSFLAGARVSIRKHKRVTPFVHALFGPTRVSVRSTENGETSSDSDTGFSMFLGGGLDIKVNDHVAIRAIQIEYGRANLFDESQTRGRVSVGVVFRFGKK